MTKLTYARIRRIIEHPLYWDRNYDFSLLRLQTGFDFKSLNNVRSVCLPSRGTPKGSLVWETECKRYTESPKNVSFQALISGWGAQNWGGSISPYLLKALITPEKCCIG